MFTPAGSGSESAALSLADNATGSPQSVSVSGTGTHDVVLTWMDGSSSSVVGYYVYRGTASNGEAATPLNATPLVGTTYADASVTAGATYYYVVKGVDSSGAVQDASNEASATVPAS
jgi:fibronectin type 3 domain-containing protein